MTTDAPKLTLLGEPDALACEGDACLVGPPSGAAMTAAAVEVDPSEDQPSN